MQQARTSLQQASLITAKEPAKIACQKAAIGRTVKQHQVPKK
jgi:hypothetical protein